MCEKYHTTTVSTNIYPTITVCTRYLWNVGVPSQYTVPFNIMLGQIKHYMFVIHNQHNHYYDKKNSSLLYIAIRYFVSGGVWFVFSGFLSLY